MTWFRRISWVAIVATVLAMLVGSQPAQAAPVTAGGVAPAATHWSFRAGGNVRIGVDVPRLAYNSSTLYLGTTCSIRVSTVANPTSSSQIKAQRTYTGTRAGVVVHIDFVRTFPEGSGNWFKSGAGCSWWTG